MNDEDKTMVAERWAGVVADAKQLMEAKEAERRREREMMRVHRPWRKLAFSNRSQSTGVTHVSRVGHMSCIQIQIVYIIATIQRCITPHT